MHSGFETGLLQTKNEKVCDLFLEANGFGTKLICLTLI